MRVELSPDRDSRLPLQHGQPGSAEVMTEQIAPAALLLRLAGQLVAPPVSNPAREQAP